MAVYALTNFHEALRALLGDQGDLATGFDFVNEQLNAGLRTVVNMGFVPCLELSAGDPSVTLVGPPVNPDTWGYLVAKAAHLMVGGESPLNIRTRALSVMSEAAARRDSLTHIETMLSEIDARGNVCGAAEDRGHKGLFSSVGDVITYCQVGSCTPAPWHQNP